MNRPNPSAPLRTSLLKSTILALALMGAAAPAAANQAPGARLATGVGQWIAAQGNAALREIREDFRKRMNETFKPVLPAPAPAAQPTR